jgi:hypothetical protein
MSLTIVSITNPQWANAEHTAINVTARFSEINEDLPFTAIPNDTEAHGREIFTRTSAGEFGSIDAYVPPSDTQIAAEARMYRNQLLAESDWTQLPDVPQALKNVWAAYRQALRDITAQSGFPRTIVYPNKPQ